jgi:peptidoglycan/xylan/chitin deacetylase (PgdA/CDA1 family)
MSDDRLKWPNGAKCAVMLSFDFDAETNWMARDPLNYRRPGIISQGTYGAKVGVHKILELLRQEEIRATFFVPGWVVDNRTESVEAIVNAGHEVAHHGYLHKPIQPGDEAAEIEELERGLDAHHRRLGKKPIGYRAPYGDTSPNLIKLLSQNGFLYDSTLMDDVRPYRLGLEDGTPGPVELPWHWSLDDAIYMLFSLRLERAIQPNEHVLSIWKAEFKGLYEGDGFFDLLMHPQATGRPSRISLLREFIHFTKEFEGVWHATASEIASAWAEQHPDAVPSKITPFVHHYE